MSEFVDLASATKLNDIIEFKTCEGFNNEERSFKIVLDLDLPL